MSAQPNVQIRMQAELVGLSQDADGVEVRYRHTTDGTTGAVRATYVLGCDGGLDPAPFTVFSGRTASGLVR